MINEPLETTFVGILTEKPTYRKQNDCICYFDEHFYNQLFRKKKKSQSWKQEQIEGPLYIDPFLIDKVEKCNSLQFIA